MQEEIQSMAETGIVGHSRLKNFNYNKLQAVLCIAASAILSSILISWVIQHFF